MFVFRIQEQKFFPCLVNTIEEHFFLDRWHTRANGLKEGANEMKEFVFASLKSRCEVCPISLFVYDIKSSFSLDGIRNQEYAPILSPSLPLLTPASSFRKATNYAYLLVQAKKKCSDSSNDPIILPLEKIVWTFPFFAEKNHQK